MLSNSTEREAGHRQPGSPWSVADAARFLQISERHLLRLIQQEQVKTFVLGRRRFVSDTEVRRVAEGGVS